MKLPDLSRIRWYNLGVTLLVLAAIILSVITFFAYETSAGSVIASMLVGAAVLAYVGKE